MAKTKWFIPFNVPSSKNGRRWTGKYFIASKAVMNYRKATKDIYAKYADEFKAKVAKLNLPVKVSFEFINLSLSKVSIACTHFSMVIYLLSIKSFLSLGVLITLTILGNCSDG